jgi:small subunit ribosomal protein SAe
LPLVSNPAFFYLQVDLFFYRDPEEAKELEEEEAVAAPEYVAVAEYTAPAGDTWGSEWGAGEAAPTPAQTGTEWTAASGLSLLFH